MNGRYTPLFVLVFVCVAVAMVPAADPTPQELLANVGIKPQGDRRGQMDIVGFAHTATQMDDVAAQCRTLAAPRLAAIRTREGWDEATRFVAAVCPHDDYTYAGRLYDLALSGIKARTVILFGVFHKARVFDSRDRLVFDAYRRWYGPYGDVTVSPLRDEIIHRLPSEDYTVSNDMSMVEHSLEAIVPFLQAGDRKVQIVPILVPYMGWDRMEKLAADLSATIAAIAREKGLTLGKDLAVVCSTDAVHYGDAGWGGSNYAPFGTDAPGYEKAVARDRSLAENDLAGPVMPEKLKGFLYRCVDPADVTRYQITWCGRFSVPFGLNVTARLTRELENRELRGTFLDYGTSVSEPGLDMSGLDGMGTTAPNNLHHFVGYAAIAYR